MTIKNWLQYILVLALYHLRLIHAYHRDSYGNWRIGNA